MTTRDITVLYDMTSYQDMTDEEIDMLIEFKINLAVNNALTEFSRNAENTAYDTLLNKTLELIDNNNQVFNTLLNVEPELGVINLE